MKKTLFYLCALLLLLLSINLHAQQYKWVKGGGSAEWMTGSERWEGEGSICTDPAGNVYSISVMGNSAPIVADTFHRPTGAYADPQNVFISSYSCSGQMRWAKLIGSNSGECYPYAITTDTAGHVYVAAYISNATSHIGYDTTITGSVYLRQCLIQYDTTGHLSWMRFLGNNIPATLSAASFDGSSLAVDSFGNIHFICSMRYGMQITPSLISHWGTYDIEFDALGNMLSTRKLQLDSTLTVYKSIIDKKSGKLYSIGSRNKSVFPDSSYHSYVAAFDLNRNIIWKDTLSCPYFAGSQNFGDLVCRDGYIYLAGFGAQSIAYKTDTVTNPYGAGAHYTSFVLKIDTAGNPKWMKGFSSTISISYLNGITFLGNNKIAAGGIMAGTLTSGADNITIYPGEGQNPFFTILDTAGDIFTLQQIHGAGFYDGIGPVTSDRAGSLYMQGNVETTIWGGAITPYSSVGGTSDYFVMKYGADCSCAAGPIASFTAVGTHTVNFTYTGITAGIDSVRWFFGDGGTSTLFNPIHIYTSTGTFRAFVRVYSHCGGDVTGKDIVITCPLAPVASFMQSGLYNKSFTYTGSSSGIDSMRWKFGDGSTSTLTNPTHTYMAPGTYTVCVSVYTWCSWDSACMVVTVPCVTAPTAHFTHSATAADSTGHFTYTGTSAVDSIKWSFGDGSDTTGTSANHHYATTGTFTVCAVAYSQCGNDTLCDTIKIRSSLSVSEEMLQAITIFPNPVKNEFVIEHAANCIFVIYNVVGQKIQEGTIESDRQAVNVVQLPSAVYLIQLTSPDGMRRSLRLFKE